LVDCITPDHHSSPIRRRSFLRRWIAAAARLLHELREAFMQRGEVDVLQTLAEEMQGFVLGDRCRDY
jgi:hypothetical protein